MSSSTYDFTTPQITVGVALALALSAAAAVAAPSAVCPVVETAPQIDGADNEAPWESAFLYEQFTDNLGKRPAEPPMAFRAITDGPRLYLALHMSHPNPQALADAPVTRDDTTLFSQDCVEIFLAPNADEPAYYHLAFGPTGSFWDSSGSLTEKDFNYNVEYTARIGDKGWTVEVAVPLDELGLVGGVKAGHSMALNVCREYRSPEGATRLHCWSPTGAGFHRREAFGQLLIGTYSASARARVDRLGSILTAVRESEAARTPAVAEDLPFWADRLAELRRRIPSLDSADHWQAFEQAADEAEAELRRLGVAARGLLIYELNPWDLPKSTDLPTADVAEPEEVALTALRGEYVTHALGVANATREPLRVQITSTDWLSPNGMERLPARDHLALREAVEVGLRGGGVIRDALPDLDPAHHLSIPSGRNGILWMTVDAHDMPAGIWVLGLKVMPLLQPELRRNLRVVLRVLPVDIPRGPRPFTSNWYSFTHQPSKYYPDAAAEDLKAHYTNVIHTRVGFPEYDADGKMTKDADFTRIEEDMERFGIEGVHFLIGRFYHWFPPQLGNKGEWTEEQQERFAYLIKRVRQFFEGHGLTVEDFSWYARDEPTTVETAQSVVNFGKRLQLVDPQQRVFVTTYSKVTKEAIEMMLPYVNLWVPSLGLSDWQHELIASRRDEGVRFFSYSVISKASNAYWAYRLSAWRALRYDYEGIGFWCYDDVGGPGLVNWDDTDGKKSDYAVIYEGAQRPVTSVRWEAWRQGVQDYRYVEWVRSLAAACEDAALAKSATEEASSSVGRVLAGKDRATADETVTRLRSLALQMLAKGDVAPDTDLPFNLTGNGGPLSRHLDTHGSYAYNQYMLLKHYGEACQVMKGPIYFKGQDATEEPQSKNKIDGNLTDDLIRYPSDYNLWSWPPAKVQITFDLKAPYKLSHLLALFIDQQPEQTATVYVGDSDQAEEQAMAASIPGTEQVRTPSGELFFDLSGHTGRFVRLEIASAGKVVRMGEVRIWGWPTQ